MSPGTAPCPFLPRFLSGGHPQWAVPATCLGRTRDALLEDSLLRGIDAGTFGCVEKDGLEGGGDLYLWKRATRGSQTGRGAVPELPSLVVTREGSSLCFSAGVQRVEEGGWNTVQGAKNSRVLDPTKFLKITKVCIQEAAFD